MEYEDIPEIGGVDTGGVGTLRALLRLVSIFKDCEAPLFHSYVLGCWLPMLKWPVALAGGVGKVAARSINGLDGGWGCGARE